LSISASEKNAPPQSSDWQLHPDAHGLGRHCRKCRVVLTRKNWSKSRRRNNDYVCQNCKAKYDEQYYQTHQVKIIRNVREWRREHRDKNPQYRRTYYRKHKTQHRAGGMRWKKANPEKQKAIYKIYRETPKGIENNRKHARERKRSIRTDLVLNEWFPNSHLHHILNGIVLFIPSKIHNSVSHDLLRHKNMFDINTKAISWWLEHFHPLESQQVEQF